MFDLFEHGLLMDEAGGADGGGVAVADAASDFGTPEASPGAGNEDQSDSEVHDAEFVDDKPAVESTALVKAGERAVVNGKFTQSGRAAIEALKPLSPKLAQEVTQALLTRDYFHQQFPGGKKDVQQLLKLKTEYGGDEEISRLKNDVAQFDALDNLYLSGDPGFIEKITESPEGQQGFVMAMPHALEKFEKLAPQQFGYQMAKAFVHLMSTGALPTSFATQAAILNRAGRAFTEKNYELAASFLAEIIDNHNAIHDFFQKITEAAKTEPPAVKKPTDPQLDGREKQLSEREKALQRQEWETAVGTERRRLFAKSWSELTKGRNLTADQDSTVKGFYELRMSTKIRQWQNQAQRFFANGDKDGYLKEQFGFFQRAIPEALRQAIQQAIPAKPGPKPAGGPVKPPVRGAPSGNGAVSAIKVAKWPQFGDWDVSRTTNELLSANRYYGKDGKLYEVRA